MANLTFLGNDQKLRPSYLVFEAVRLNYTIGAYYPLQALILNISIQPKRGLKKKLNLLAKGIGKLSVIIYFKWLAMKEALA